MTHERSPSAGEPGPLREPRQAFRVVLVAVGLLVASAALTLRTVVDAGVRQVESPNPTPHGYTWSLLLFLLPLAVLGVWFARRRDLGLARRACGRTLAVLVPLGFGLDLLFGNAFFVFPNHAATLGLNLPAVGGPLPFEEFVFYASGFMLVLLSYVWADEYWLRAYNIPDYRSEARELRRLAQFHGWSLVFGVGLVAGAVIYRQALGKGAWEAFFGK